MNRCVLLIRLAGLARPSLGWPRPWHPPLAFNIRYTRSGSRRDPLPIRYISYIRYIRYPSVADPLPLRCPSYGNTSVVHWSGSTSLPPTHISQCRCGPVTRPVAP
jgi:hypothetical protein